MRATVLHYHIFKNAGSSFNYILNTNFPGRCVKAEFPPNVDNSQQVTEWIAAERHAVAFSTHTAFGPLPQLADTQVISVVFLRDPIDRIRSAYQFERRQGADTFGSRLARQTDLEGYVRARLDLPGDPQCRNFHTHRLASLNPGGAPALERAVAALQMVSFVGRVEAFGASVAAFARVVRPFWPDFHVQEVVLNRAAPAEVTRISPALRRLLEEVNADDLQLYQAGLALWDEC